MQVTISLSPQKQRLIALILATIPILAFIAAILSFVGGQIDRHRQASLLIRKIAQERAVLAQAPIWQEQLLRLRTSPDWQRMLVPKSRDQIRMLEALTQRVGVKVDRSSTRRMETSGAAEIDERGSFMASIEQLTKILETLRGRWPIFVIRSLAVEDVDRPSSPEGARPHMLQVDLTVAEFERPS